MTETHDRRRVELETWVTQVLGPLTRTEPASSDASFRRYFRFHCGGQTVIGMDAPPEHESCDRFIAVAELLARNGVHVPAILARDQVRGFLLLDDLGRDTYLDVLSPANAGGLFGDALETLVRIQRIDPPADTPSYDAALLQRELELFPRWFVAHHLAQDPRSARWSCLRALTPMLVQRALAQPAVLVHRDYMPRNLMVSDPNPGVLDFQDAVVGPVAYDPLCLFRDAFVSWPDRQVEIWLEDYWRIARAARVPVPASPELLLRDCEDIGVQRHLKVLGIFARICHRDGKPRYLADAPRFLSYLEGVAQRRSDLAGLSELVSRVREGEAQ